MLELKNISKTFEQDMVKTPVLKRVSFTVKQGEIAVLVGGSGVGKSTLLRVLNNLEPMDEGLILFDGRVLDPKTIHKNHIISMVFQNAALFKHLTAKQNITLVLEKVLGLTKKEADERAASLLKRCGIEKYADMPVTRLSGGQQQRLAIARALAVNPKVLCLDEPTSALDPLLTKHIAQLIKELAQSGYAIIITTHDMALIADLDCTLYLMEAGFILEKANSKDLQKHPEEYKRLHAFMQGITHKEDFS